MKKRSTKLLAPALLAACLLLAGCGTAAKPPADPGAAPAEVQAVEVREPAQSDSGRLDQTDGADGADRPADLWSGLPGGYAFLQSTQQEDGSVTLHYQKEDEQITVCYQATGDTVPQGRKLIIQWAPLRYECYLLQPEDAPVVEYIAGSCKVGIRRTGGADPEWYKTAETQQIAAFLQESPVQIPNAACPQCGGQTMQEQEVLPEQWNDEEIRVCGHGHVGNTDITRQRALALTSRCTACGHEEQTRQEQSTRYCAGTGRYYRTYR